MKSKKANFQVTIGYRAIVTFDIKAEDAEQAKKIVLLQVKEIGIYNGDVQDETYSAAGVLNVDESWNMVNG